jgi:plasmid stabilization system protein ParE
MLPVVYLPEARDDLGGTYSHYETLRPGLGDRFLDEFRRVMGLIAGNPCLFGEVFDGVRAAGVRRFPYVVYYGVEPSQVVVIAVRHGHDDPAVWQARVP